ncbi:MAG: UPF0182 family protein [Actinobacteria bacterium]|nr:MAG: UPF0182 family protein [Actinomycetota bacterium]
MEVRNIRLAIIGIIAFIVVSILLSLVGVYINWLWFGEVGYLSVFWKIIYSQWGIGIVSGIIFFIFILANILLARRLAPKYRVVLPEPWEKIKVVFEQTSRLIIFGVSLVISFFAGLAASSIWQELLMFINSSKFGTKDPVFNLDIGFYVFKLPFLQFLQGWLLALFIVTLIATTLIHWLDGAIKITSSEQRFAPHVRAHVSTLLAFIFFDVAFLFRLNMYNLLYSTRGVAVGASYTDVHADLPILWFLFALSIIVGLVLIINSRLKSWRIVVFSVLGMIAVYFVIGQGYPALIQSFRVKPNEAILEKPFIKRNIQATLKAYKLDNVDVVPFSASEKLGISDVQGQKLTVDNIRLWDPIDAVRRTYTQIQGIKPYYVFPDIDIDRYKIDGKVTEVNLTAREIDVNNIPQKTWVNQKLRFTHGYGLAMAPVSDQTAEGLPNLIIKDLPPTSSTNVKLKRPQIYFGQQTGDYCIVDTNQSEFDFPRGNNEVNRPYKGTGGVEIGSLWRRLVFAYGMSDINILLTAALKPTSRIIFDRGVFERVNKIAPFLNYDSDPYVVVDAGGNLKWMLDAYTTSSMYPYSQPKDGINYIRNSVKVVIDAYDGTVDFYVIDKRDPVIRTYRKIFPKLFKDFEKMSASLKEHIRYPEDLFKIQSDVYLKYHMTDPSVFYTNADLWSIPNTFKGQMVPYYVALQLKEQKGNFLIIQPFTPNDKDNMVTWLSASSDLPDYGNLVLYSFPRGKLVFGPKQIEGRIDQDPVISSQFTLLNQSGSNVIRGNLLVIPIKDSLIYVEPIYLEATDGGIPELKKVIVAFNNKIAMEDTFDSALSKVFTGASTAAKPTPQAPTPGVQPNVSALVNQANQLFTDAVNKQKSGDWAGYGTSIDQLGKVLDQLQQQAK